MPKSGNAPSVALQLFEPDPEEVTGIARDNLQRCFQMAKRDQRLSDRTNANLLAKHIAEHREHYGDTVSKSHIYRTAKGEGPVGTDVLHVIAKAYGLQAWHMLMPGMQPANPPVVIVDERQRRMYQSIEDSMREVREQATMEVAHAKESPADGAHEGSNSASTASRPRNARSTRSRGEPATPRSNRGRAKA